MRSSIAIILHAQIVQAHFNELSIEDTVGVQDNMSGNMVDELLLQLVDKLVERTIKVLHLDQKKLEETTLAKPYRGASCGTPCSKLHVQVGHAPFAVSRSSSSMVRSPYSGLHFPAPHRRSLPVSLAETSQQDTKFPLCQVAMGIQPASGPRVPVWMFRQAGRHLPEYIEFMAERGNNFQGLLENPADVAEVTLQPQRRYAVDAAILFSDILTIPKALGVDIQFPNGNSVYVPNPLKEPEDLARLPKVEEAASDAFIEGKLGYVIEGVRKILEQMQKEGFDYRPLIGFSAAPWTILFFMVGSYSKKDEAERWCREHKAASKELLSLLTRVIIEYLSAQARAGCHALQVFEAMAMHISEESFQEFALPALTEIARELRSRHPGVPLMVFPRGASYSLAQLQTAGYDVVTVDTDTDLALAAQALRDEAKRTGGRVATLQGNFNPRWLQPKEGGTPEMVREKVREMLDASGALEDGPLLIANLGEGLSGKESPELVNEFVNAVHEMSIKA
eukprot:gnl/MRDRNA2_/MRDRNA2_82776_c0_seq1.p1 gnl/MRDRNA2_/MRDRNA2_82776_c0~~gnl/MRDRNA2_/MRDRNA2_82776_c0_seq1.p1  ORF type:complete len:507 (+),score=99.03 gnl/MRDRNA2_/MRDRNA2_82776_c0_seq1:92-1612(+)